MPCPVGSRSFASRPLAVEPPTGRKNMRATRPQTPRQVRITCTPAKQVCRIYKNSMVQVRCICRSPAAQAGRRRRNPPPERSNLLNGENLIYQVRELRRNPLWSCAVPVGSRNFVPRPLAVGTADGGKEHEGSAPSYSAAGENHLHPGKLVCRFQIFHWHIKIMDI